MAESLSGARVLKFPLSEKMFHNINMVTWMLLALSGILIYFRLVSPESALFFMDLHMVVAVVFTINFVGFAVINADRFFLMIRNLLIWDKDTILWFRNFGNYPRRLFGIPFGPAEVTPQGRFNAGQKGTYLFFMFMIFALIVTGWLLYAFTPAMGKLAVEYMFLFHVWGSIVATALAVGAHFPLAVVNWEDFKAMFRFGPGDVPLEEAIHHSPKWVRDDIMKVTELKEDLTAHHAH